MRLTGIRLPLLAALACAGVGLFVWATERTYGDTVYVVPTSRTVVLSSSYVLPTSYVVPSSYVFPSYIESSYAAASVGLLPTGYIETTYRRGLFGRRWVVERPVIASYATTYVPSSYVSAYVPTTYVSPTTYIAPTTYLSPTRYIAPTYYTTSYRLPRYRATTYSYYPTVYETAYTSATDLCCDEVVLDSPASTTTQPSVISSPAAAGRKEVESGAAEDPTIPAYVDTQPPGEIRSERSTLRNDPGTNAQTSGAPNRADSPPRTPVAGTGDDAGQKAAPNGAAAAPKNDSLQKAAGAPATKPKPNPPAAPADDADGTDLRPAPENDGVTRRDSLKAVYPRMRTVDRRNILFGTVETDDGRPRGEVPVTVVNRNNTAIRHRGLTNAFGGYAIHVPDGQWNVRVTMPSGSTQSVRDITVTGGRIVDNLEAKEVHNLIISY